MIKNILKSVVISYIVSFILLLIGAIIMFYGHISDKSVSALIIVIYFISNLIGGLNAGKLAQRKKFLQGIVVGVIYFLILFILSIIGNNEESVINSSVFICCGVSLFGGMIGGMIS